MKQSINVLHIEDSKEDSELIQRLLANDGIHCDVTRVETRAKVFDELENNSFDLILADCKLPQFSGLHALEIAHALKPEIPFVFVSGTIGEETAIESFRNGATDYVQKGHLARLASAVRRALAEAEERRLCRQLQQRLHEAARLEAISTLSNGIAHDFNNILTIILGHSSLLAVVNDQPERVIQIAKTITEAGKRASEIVEQLLAFAHKSGGEVTSINLNQHIQHNLGLLKANLPPQVKLAFEPTKDLPKILADTGKLECILSNLVTNSVDSMPMGGLITLSTRQVAAADVPGLPPELDDSHYICLKIADTGSGMDEATREHVFEPFYTTKERGRGTGLGLPVVYGLMQAQNGCVDIESSVGQGTAISLYFPVARNEAKSTPAVTRELDPALCGSETILVIEDEVDIGYFLETVFQTHGYQVLYAHDHDEALKLFEENRDKIQLVFSDIGLPKVDGITICTKLKAARPELPVILTSGYSPQEFKPRLEKLGNNAFLSKPLPTPEILRCVRKVLADVKA